jgi:hypothetical protein
MKKKEGVSSEGRTMGTGEQCRRWFVPSRSGFCSMGRLRVLSGVFASAGALLLFLGCAVTPRVSTWDSPKRFTAKDVFSAALQAGSQEGMQLSASDRESGTMSFRRTIGKGEMILSVTVKDVGGRVQVSTTAAYGGDLAIRGLHEECINNFHTYLFRNLGITDASERNVDIRQQS